MSKRLRSSEVCADCSGPGESHRLGPLSSALLRGTPAPGPPPRVGRVPAAEPHTWGRGEEEPGRPRNGTRPGPVRAGLAGGGRRPPVPPSPLILSRPLCPRPGGEAAGSGPLPQQEGAWAIHRKANYRSKMRAFSRLRPPEAAGVAPLPSQPPRPPPREGPLLRVGALAASVHQYSPGDYGGRFSCS